MSLDFFNEACKYPPTSAETFGLCDDNDSVKAYPDFENTANWIAEVRNRNHLEITVIAIDKCILHDHEYKGRGRCDCMLITDTHLYLVELKDKRPPWQEEAIEQLESTMQFLEENHDITQFKKKKIYACNKKKKRFVVMDNGDNIAYFRKTGFRKDIQARIVVI